MRHVKWTIVFITLFLGASLQIAKADIRLKLIYDSHVEVSTMQLPTSGEIDFVLKKNDVDVYGSNLGSMFYVGSKSKGEGDLFGPIKISVHADTHRIEFVGAYRSHIEHVVITTDGVSSCSARISVALRPGHHKYEFVYGGVHVEASRMFIGNVRCELSTA